MSDDADNPDAKVLLDAVDVLRANYVLINETRRAICGAQRQAEALGEELKEVRSALGAVLHACRAVLRARNDLRQLERELIALLSVTVEYDYLRKAPDYGEDD